MLNSDLKIKVCGLMQVDQINQLNTMQVDYLGVIFHEQSPRHLALLIDAERISKLTLVTVNQTFENIVMLSEKYNSRILQLHGEETPAHCKKLTTQGFTIIKAFSIDDTFNFNTCEPYMDCVDFYLFDTKGKSNGGNGIKFNWQLLNQYQLSKPFFLSGGLEASDAENIKRLDHPALYGIDINSKFEFSPGIKNIEKIRDFISKIKTNEQH